MKIVTLLASPRKNGNTALLLNEVLKEIKDANIEVKSYYLNGLNIRGCQACYACKKSDRLCVLKDDATEIIEELTKADRVIIATPVYMFDITAQLKRLIDRLFCFLKEDYSSKIAPDKKVLWLITQGNIDKNRFKSILENNANLMNFIGFGENRLFITENLRTPGDVLKREDVLLSAKKEFEWLIKK